jgi:hypothetical protein
VSQGPALHSPAPRSRQAGHGWSLLGLYKACKLTLCGEPAEGALGGSGREGEGWGRRRLERVLAILGPVETAGSQGGPLGCRTGGRNGALPLRGVVVARPPKRGKKGDPSWNSARVVPPTQHCSHSEVTQFPASPPARAVRLARSRPKEAAQAPISPRPASPQKGGGRGRSPREEAVLARSPQSSLWSSTGLWPPNLVQSKTPRADIHTCSAPRGRCFTAGTRELRWNPPPAL